MKQKKVVEFNMQYELYSRLKKAKPYVYKIRDNYYCIGASVFRECSVEEIALYNEICQELEHLENCGYDLENRDTRNVVQKFNLLCSKISAIYDYSQEGESNQSLINLLKNCDKATLESIDSQKKTRKILIDFSDGAPHRYNQRKEGRK